MRGDRERGAGSRERQLQSSGDRGQGTGPKFAAIAAACLAVGILSCQRVPVRTIEIEAVDYSFSVLGSVAPGPASFHLINRDDVPHQVQLYRFRPGIRVDSAWKLLALKQFPAALTEGAPLVMSAVAMDSAPSRVTADLKAGELWALVCMFQDSPEGPKHNTEGMYSVLEVK